MYKLGFLGCGNMGRAILLGLLESGRLAGQEIVVCDRHPDRLEAWREKYGFAVLQAGSEQARRLPGECEYLLLGVKPGVMQVTLSELDFTGAKPVVISVAAGTPLAKFEQWLGSDIGIIRVMPNVNAQVGESMSALCANDVAGPEALAEVVGFFESVGRTVVLAEEKFSVFSAIAGCAPAWVYRFADALAQGAVAEGLSKAQAVEIAAQTLLGSALTLLNTGLAPQVLIDQVCSPGGTTVAGLLAMEEAGFSPAAVKAVRAAVARDKQLAAG